jgi:hypothetical protein
VNLWQRLAETAARTAERAAAATRASAGKLVERLGHAVEGAELVPPHEPGPYRADPARYEAWLRSVLRDDILRFVPQAGPGSLPVDLRRFDEAMGLTPEETFPAIGFRPPQRGDVIKRPIRDPLYQFFATHYGLYLSDESVIHYNSAQSDTSAEANRVIETSLAEFAAGYGVVIEEYTDLPARSPDDAEATARSLLGEGGYDLLHRNCEHLATWCRYGRAFSSQSRHEAEGL